jgi:hypothetical protein
MAAPVLDHLVYATPDLKATVRELGGLLGVMPSAGGQHVGRGTRNYLLGLGNGSYLEIIGRDPEQIDFTGVRPFGLNGLERQQLVGWAVRVADIEAHVRKSQAAGYDTGPLRAMSRMTPSGEPLSWKLTAAGESAMPRLIPFLIDWGSTRHPSHTSAQGARLVDFHLLTSDPVSVRAELDALEVTCRVDSGASSKLVAEIAGPSGQVGLE